MKWKLLLAGMAGTLMLAFCVCATAKQAAPTTAQTAAQDGSNAIVRVSSTQQNTQTDNSGQAENSGQAAQAMSLGDLARMVRAKRKADVKAVKVIDNDDIPSAGGGAG